VEGEIRKLRPSLESDSTFAVESEDVMALVRVWLHCDHKVTTRPARIINIGLGGDLGTMS
jgi:hypothetical protein